MRRGSTAEKQLMACQQIPTPVEAVLNAKNPLVNKDSCDNEKKNFLKNGSIKSSFVYCECVAVSTDGLYVGNKKG